jgi:hypothetical protein
VPPIARDQELGAGHLWQGDRAIVVRALGNALCVSFPASIVRSVSHTNVLRRLEKGELGAKLPTVPRPYELVEELVRDHDEVMGLEYHPTSNS